MSIIGKKLRNAKENNGQILEHNRLRSNKLKHRITKDI